MKIKDLAVERLKLEELLEIPPAPGHERYLHLLCGSGEVEVGDLFHGPWWRKSVFERPEPGIYVPSGEAIKFAPNGSMDVLVVSSPAGQWPDPTLVVTHKVHEIGWGHHKRTVYEILGGEGPALRIRLGETHNVPGGWSSWPPHRFDADLSMASEFEEAFLPFMRPKDGFALMRRKGRWQDGSEVDDAVALTTGVMVPVPLGSHPIVAGPETSLVYVWAYLSPEPKVYAKWAEDAGCYK